MDNEQTPTGFSQMTKAELIAELEGMKKENKALLAQIKKLKQDVPEPKKVVQVKDVPFIKEQINSFKKK